MHPGLEGGVAREPVDLVWALLVEVGDRGMVADLFHVDTSAVWHPSLIGLTQDWVEGFVEDVARISKRY